MTGTIISVENAPGALVTVVVQCGDRERVVPVDGVVWAAMVRARGPALVIGAAVSVAGSGAAASIIFLAEAP